MGTYDEKEYFIAFNQNICLVIPPNFVWAYKIVKGGCTQGDSTSLNPKFQLSKIYFKIFILRYIQNVLSYNSRTSENDS